MTHVADIAHTPKLIRLICAFPSVFIGFILAAIFAARWALNGRPRDRRMLAIVVCTIGAGILCNTLAEDASNLHPWRYDLFIYRLDSYLGFQPSFALGRLLLPHAWGVYGINIIYGLISVAAMAVLAAYLWRPAPEAPTVIAAFTFNVLLAPLFYWLFPVSGPQFAFPSFPADPGLVTPHLLLLHAPPNGIPSVHCSTAILVWWFSRRWPLGQWLGLANLLLTIIVTLASGQHYFFDLLAAVPYVALVLKFTAAAERFARRKTNTQSPLARVDS